MATKGEQMWQQFQQAHQLKQDSGISSYRELGLATEAARAQNPGVKMSISDIIQNVTGSEFNKRRELPVSNASDVRHWFQRSLQTIDEMVAYNADNEGKFTRDYGGVLGPRVKELLNSADNVSRYLQSHGDSEMHSQWDQALSQYREALQNLDTYNDQSREYYGQFKDETEYGWGQKYIGQDVSQLRLAAEGLEDGDEKAWLTGYADSLEYNNALNYDMDKGAQELQELETRRRDMQGKNDKWWQYQNNPLMHSYLYQSTVGGNEYEQLKAEMEVFEKEGGLAGLDQQIRDKRAEIANARQVQDKVRQEQEHEEWLKTVRAPEVVNRELESARAQAEQLKEDISLGKDSLRTAMGGINMDAAAALEKNEAAYQQTLDQITQLEKEAWWAQKQVYDKLQKNPDFVNASVYVPTISQDFREGNKQGRVVFTDPMYEYINRNPSVVSQKMAQDQESGAIYAGTDWTPLLMMQDDEVKTYNYLYATQGKDAANRYVEHLRSELNARQRATDESAAAQVANSGKMGQWFGSGMSVLASPFRGLAYLGQAADLMTTGKIDQNAGYNRVAYAPKAMRDTVTQSIESNPKWGKAGAFGYQVAMSMGDFLMSSALSGGSSNLASLILGTGAAADAVVEAKDRGLSDVQAFSLGTIAGIAEQLTEKYSLETLLDADVLKDSVLKYIRKNMLAEASEEAASSVINFISDVLISKDKSQWKQSIQQFQDLGWSREEAFVKAVAQQAAAIGLDALGGAISGGVLGGRQAVNFSLQARGAGKMANALGMDQQAAQQFVNAGLQAAPDSTARQVAEQMQSKLNQGKTLTEQDKGRLVYSDPKLANQMARANAGTVRLATPQVNVGNTDERWQQAQRLAGITGRNIVFYNGVKAENGYYDNKTGEIYINANGPEAAVQTFSHELTHSTELAEVYKDLEALCFQKLRSLGQDVAQLRQDKMTQYENAGHPLASKQEANAEIVADFVAKYLLTDERTIFDVVADSPTVGQQILRWIDGILARFGNENAKERVFLDNARKIYSKALEQTRNRQWMEPKKAASDLDTGAQQSGQQATEQTVQDDEETAAIQEITEAYEAGELDETLYKTIVDNIRQEYSERRASGRQYSFAGENAKTADLQALRRAKDMQAQGVADETIRQQTGWFRGMDGKWRFEIDDSGMKYHRAGDARFSQMHEDYARHQELTGRLLEGEISQQEMNELQELDEIWGQERGRLNRRVTDGNVTLQNLIQHDALFEAYPDLRGVKVRFENLNRNTLGQFYPNANLIILSSSLRDAPQSTILHEVQHAIQRAEGFSSGSSREYWDQRLSAGDNPHTRGMTEAWQRLDAFEEDPANAEVMDMIRRLEDAESDNAYEALEREAEQRGLMDRIREHEQLEMEYYSQESQSFNMMPSELYENTAGEIEARDVSQRRTMDAESRKKSPPNLGDERTVFAEGAGRSYSIANITGANANYGPGVLLDTNIFNGVKIRDWGKVLGNFVYQNLAGHQLIVYDAAGNQEIIYFARKNDRVTKDGAKNSHRVIDELARYKGDNIKALATVHISELVATAQTDNTTSDHSHQWLDENGWEHKTAYLEDRSGDIYEATLNIANGRDRRILYAVNNVRKIDKRTAHGAVPSTSNGRGSHIKSSSSGNSVTQPKTVVKRQYSISSGNTQQGSEVRDNLDKKASDYLARVENRFVRKLGEQLGIPRYAQWDVVRPAFQQITDEFLQTGKISDETIRKAFDIAYDQGKVIDREFYDQYKEVRDYLRTTGVTLSQSDKSNIPDYNQWVKGVFGSLRVVNEGGLPVDSAYQELQEMAPELFPARITHPADQLMRMAEVSKQIRKVEKSLDEYYGPEADTFRSWARHDFGVSVGDMMPDLRTVKRYAEQERKTAAQYPPLKSNQEAQEAFRARKQALREKEKVIAKNLLSDKDKEIVKDLISGLRTLDDIQDMGDRLNLKGIREVYEATREYEMIDRQIRRYQAQLRQQRQDEADKHLGSSLYWRDKKSGFAYARETMRRNILDIVSNKHDAYALLRTYFEPVQAAEAERQRFLNEFRDKVRQLNLSQTPAKGDEVSEAYAVQLYGEAITSIEMIQQSKGRIKERDGRDLDDWQGLILDMYQHSPSLDKEKIENAVKEFRAMYDDFFVRMNEVLVRNGYPPVDYRKGYFPHFQGQDDGVAARFSRLLGVNFLDDVLPTTINGMTHKFRPGKQWFAHAQERTGFETTYDAVEGFDRYIEGVSNVIYHTDNIQRLRALAKQIRYRSSDEGIREQVRKVQEDDSLSDEDKENRIEKIYESGRFALSNFVRELDEYTNILAGKKSMADRSAEHWLSRKYYTWMKALEAQIGANMVGGNLTSALTNFIPLTQAWGQLDTTNLLDGMRDTLMAMKQSDGFAASSDFLTRRKGSEKLTQTWIQKASAKASLPMELIDGFTSEAIVRGAYYQNIKRGMSEDEALRQADLFAANVMADRSKGALPTIFEMRNPVAKIFTQFQTEVNNQMSEVFKDLPRAAREKNSREIVAMVFKYFFGAWLFNEIYELLIGRRPALDPINMAWETVEDWQEGGLFVAGQNLANSVIENLPFVSGIAGGGRVPMASALPDVGEVWGALAEKPYDEATGDGMAMRKRLNVLGTELSKPAMLLAFPFAGNQVMKSWKGIKTLIEGGSYTIDNAGNKHLQYAVHMDDPWTIFRNSLLASVMGKSALPEAREWTAGGFGSFTAAQTEIYQDLLNSGAGSREAYQLIDDLRSAQKTETESRAAVQRKLLDEFGMPDEARAIVYYGMLADEKERALMDKLTDLGATSEEAGNVVRKLWDADQLPSDQKKAAQAEVLHGSNLTDEEKREVVASILGTDLVNEKGNPTEYAKFITAADAGLSVDSYMNMRAKGVYMDDFFEFTDTGVSCEMAADITMKMKDLKPNAGYSSVSYLQRAQVVLDADMTENQKLSALAAVSGLYDSTYAKIELGYYMGMGLQSYVDLRKAMPKYDANGNGSYTAKETQTAIDGALGSLSNAEKAILWQLQNKSWKPKNNPYNRDVGQLVYDALQATSAEDEPTEADPFALMRALSIID